jgi:hypothetical protein
VQPNPTTKIKSRNQEEISTKLSLRIGFCQDDDTLVLYEMNPTTTDCHRVLHHISIEIPIGADMHTIDCILIPEYVMRTLKLSKRSDFGA